MQANYGYKDGSGDYFITIDTELCDGCGDCIEACPAAIFEVGEDPHDPFSENPVAMVSEGQRNKIKYSCAQCKPDHDRPPLPCEAACGPGAISHSW
jgi:NAD-dependent dihydropyrimidine dehydrogenase PreA subunit